MSITASSANNTGSELLNTDELKNAHSEEGTRIFKQMHGGREREKKIPLLLAERMELRIKD